MDRRNFIKKIGIMGGIALSSAPAFPQQQQPKFKMGYQLFSIRDEMEKDPVATLKSLKDMGYQDFEFYGFDEEQETLYGYKPSEFKKILDDLELTITSGHYGFSPYLHKTEDELTYFVDQCIRCAKHLDSNYITWPWIASEQRTLDNFKLMARKLNLIGEQITKADLGFAYHNHGFEFEDLGGTNGYDIIVSETDPSLVKLQIDMYWVIRSSNVTLQELIDNQPGRYVMWHIKDMDKVTRDYTELGNGSIDYPKLLPDPEKSGLEHYYLEQGGNFATTSMKSAADSAAYLKRHLQQYL